MSLFALLPLKPWSFGDRGSRYLSILKGEKHFRRSVTPAKKGLLGPRLPLVWVSKVPTVFGHFCTPTMHCRYGP